MSEKGLTHYSRGCYILGMSTTNTIERDKQYTAPLVAGILGVPRSTLYDWIEKGAAKARSFVIADRSYYTLSGVEVLRLAQLLKKDRHAVGGKPGRKPQAAQVPQKGVDGGLP